ncbi:MAG: histidinol-phosphate transaminase [Bacillota bacterium]|nr:histidinol-phosphate transaminase [Bacillota bacterium]
MTIGIHGGDIYNYQKGILDFSSNINPLGYPSALKEKIYQRFDEVLVYPDLAYRSLKDKVATYLKVEKDQVFLGNGSVEILDLVISNFKRMLIVDPSFSEYRLRAKVHQLDLVAVNLGQDFKIDLDLLKATVKEGDLLVLTNPHNPSGTSLSKEELLEIYVDIVEKDAYLLLDEAFFEFADLDYDSIELFRGLGFSNVGIIRAATKFFGLPGIRLGYGVFDLNMIELLERKELPWSINSFANIAADYIFDKDFIKESQDYIFKERERFFCELKKVRGIRVFKSNANYFLLEILDKSEKEIFDQLLARNILVRRCSNYKNLKGTFIRIAIKTESDNEIFLKGIKEIMEE